MAFEATYMQEGKQIDYTPTGAVAAGEVVEVSQLVGVASSAIAANELGAIQVEGVFDFKKTAALAISLGALVYWDDTANEANVTSASNMLIGKCVKAALAADATVRVRLDQ